MTPDKNLDEIITQVTQNAGFLYDNLNRWIDREKDPLRRRALMNIRESLQVLFAYIRV